MAYQYQPKDTETRPIDRHRTNYADTSGYVSASLVKRFIAEFIDEIVTVFACVFLIIPGILYVLFQDGISGGRSVGKKLMGLRVINIKTGEPCNYKESAIRNILMIILIEYVVVLVTKDHRRIGDIVADTMVIEDN